IAAHHQVPSAVAGRGRGCRRAGRRAIVGAAHHDDVAALLAADLEHLPANLVVGDRVLGRAGITDDLHLPLKAEVKNHMPGPHQSKVTDYMCAPQGGASRTGAVLKAFSRFSGENPGRYPTREQTANQGVANGSRATTVCVRPGPVDVIQIGTPTSA